MSCCDDRRESQCLYGCQTIITTTGGGYVGYASWPNLVQDFTPNEQITLIVIGLVLLPVIIYAQCRLCEGGINVQKAALHTIAAFLQFFAMFLVVSCMVNMHE